jgi:formate-dependent nitrite reductase membrane component NrfD
MSERGDGIGLVGIALVPIACCIGLPLLAGAGVGVFTLIAGVSAGLLALVAAALLLHHVRRTRRSETTGRNL